MIRVLSYPHVDDLQPNPTAGISQVVKHYFRYLPEFDVELLPAGTPAERADVVAIHAAATPVVPEDVPILSHCHGLYFTADKEMDRWTHETNAHVIHIIRNATRVTVPSRWVAEIFRRDMHFEPTVVPHGVEWQEWQGGDDQGYVLWNKNRSSDACDPMPVNQLAMRAPKTRFLTTYAAPDPRPNIKIVGTVAHDKMQEMIKNCSVYLATTKETFGIGTLEAMAAGKPILGFDYGGTADLVEHGYSGYLARPGDYDDLTQGLEYCLQHKDALGRNASLVARHYNWRAVAEMVAKEYALTAELAERRPTVAVVIPLYNKAATILRAIRSAIHQTHPPDEIVVVDNNSSDDFREQVEIGHSEAIQAGIPFLFVNCPQQGVAYARNYGIAATKHDFICCLDADDEILPQFIERTYRALSHDRSLGIAYTALEAVDEEGRSGLSAWPGEYDFNKTLRGQNQVPTCCLFRREAWQRVGGYRQRYAPHGAGSEDADLWLRIGLAGWHGVRATSEALFRYYLGGAVSGNKEYREKDWRGDKGWITRGELPFAATSTPKNGMAHLVRQYDEPEISVIVPVGPNHLDRVIDAIDSVEAQTFRRWELIVVDDGAVTRHNHDEWMRLRDAFPYVRWEIVPDGPKGAGVARNLGAAIAKAPLLLFLDADDWLAPTALEDLLDLHHDNPDAIIYSDYIGHAYIEDKVLLTRLQQANRLIDYDNKTKQATVRYYAFDYDPNQAQQQPIAGKDPYIWNVISSLVPKAHHLAIGGFDEQMESWEDWDYWVRLAKAGKCFCRVAKPLLEYRFYTGSRRTLANPYESGESGRQLSAHLLEYMRHKYEGIEIMPGCSSCGGRRRASPLPTIVRTSNYEQGTKSQMTSDNMVLVELIDGNIGEHLIAVSGRSYGYRVSGDRFEMLRTHAELDRRVRIVTSNETRPVAANPGPRPTPPAPSSASEEKPKPAAQPKAEKAPADDDPRMTSADKARKDYDYDLTELWGINEARAVTLREKGVRSPSGVVAMGAEQIGKLFSLPEITARRIITEAERIAEAEKTGKSGKSKK